MKFIAQTNLKKRSDELKDTREKITEELPFTISQAENIQVLKFHCRYDSTGLLWKEFSTLLRLCLPVLYHQLVITSDQNISYHLFFRCPEIGNSQMLAQVKKHPLIESHLLENISLTTLSNGSQYIQGTLSEIPVISSEERALIYIVARSFDELHDDKPPDEIILPEFTGITPFEAYNRRGDVVSLLERYQWKVNSYSAERVHLQQPDDQDHVVSADFHLVRRIFYPYTDSGPFIAGKGYTPFQIFTILECQGNLSEAAQKIYDQGYGERQTAPVDEDPHLPTHQQPATTPFPIEIFPPSLRKFIEVCSTSYCSSADFWAGAVLITTALAIGDKMELVDKYKNVPVLWLVIVGDISSGKTFPLQFCLDYFKQLDRQSFLTYQEQMAEYERISKLSLKERMIEGHEGKPQPPEYFQYILNDYTPEAMVAAHEINPRGMMIYRDELKGWIDDFNRYNKSGEQSNMLSSWSRVGITYNRKTSGILSIPAPCILVSGSIQPDLLPSLAADSRAENGFLSRFCIIFPDNALKGQYNNQPLPHSLLRNWENYLDRLVKIRETIHLELNEEALTIYSNWYNYNADEINKEPVGYLKGIYGKFDIISLRLAIVVHGMHWVFHQSYSDKISAGEMEAAIRLTEYFRSTAIKVYHRIFGIAISPEPKPIENKIVANYLYSKCNLSKNEIAKMMQTSRSQIDRLIGNIEK